MENCNKLLTPDCNFKMKDKNQHIQVFVRVRPINSQERAKHSPTVLDCPGNKEVVVKERTMNNLTKTFTFDKVFGPNSKQVEVYKSVVAPLLEEVLLGYNCTVFAYGQTGTGKTFTMEGNRSTGADGDLSWDKDPLSGIVPRALNQLFDELRMQNVEFTVRVSLLELYNEELFDLLAPTEDMKLKTLRLYEDASKKGSVIIQGLEEVTVHNKHEVYDIIEKGSIRRQTASTLMNDKSSRSHTVFTVTVHIKESNIDGEELLKIGKLNLVDLAGSENIGRSGAVDKRAREAGSINQSLLTLGRVITALVERAPHIPYRESKLTRLLKDSLGGRTKTSIIATVSPASINLEETLSTLDYAHRAKNITNRPEINQKLTKKAMLKAYTEEIENLKKDLQAAREKNGVYIDSGNYARMVAQLESQGQDISERISQVKTLEDSLEKKEEELANTKVDLEDTQGNLSAANEVIGNLNSTVFQLKNVLRQVTQERDEKTHLVIKQQETEGKLSKEAFALLNTAHVTTNNLERVYAKLENKKRVEEGNLETGRRFRKDLTEQLKRSITTIGGFRIEHATLSGSQRLDLESFLQTKMTEYKEVMSSLDKFGEDLKDKIKTLAEFTTKQCKRTDGSGNTVTVVLQGHEQRLNSFLESFVGEFSNNMADLSTQLGSLHESYNSTLTNASQQIGTMHQGAETFTDSLQKEIDIAIGNFDNYVAEQKLRLKELDSTMEKRKESSAAFQKAVCTKVAKLQSVITSLMVQNDEFLKDAEENHLRMIEETSKMKLDNQLFTEKITNQIQGQQASVAEHATWSQTSYFNAVSNLNMDIQTNLNPMYAVTQSSLSNIENVAIDAINQAKVRTTDVVANIISHFSEMSENTKATISDLGKTVEGTTAEIGGDLGVLKAAATNSFNDDSKMVATIQDSIKTECDYVSKWSEDQTSQVSQQLGMLSEYYDSTYLVDLPTGATPQRKVYEYPEKLSATSPHEVIIKRFRKARKVSLPTSLESVDSGDSHSDKENSC